MQRHDDELKTGRPRTLPDTPARQRRRERQRAYYYQRRERTKAMAWALDEHACPYSRMQRIIDLRRQYLSGLLALPTS